jgi:hypothetical protein
MMDDSPLLPLVSTRFYPECEGVADERHDYEKIDIRFT